MYTLGIDIGSTTSKCVVMEDGERLAASSIVTGGIGTKGPDQALEQVWAAGLALEDMAAVTATGYGRARCPLARYQASELTCHALGAHFVFPQVRTVIDIGGQDAKVISLDEKGRMREFLMNDKCAAGTGRFLDVMANILQIPVDGLGDYAARAERSAAISSTCTVFAESEVISQLASGTPLPELVAGICDSVAGRTAALAKRMGVVPAVCMSGGVARSSGVRNALSRSLDCEILLSGDAQLFGAMGAALYAYRKTTA